MNYLSQLSITARGQLVRVFLCVISTKCRVSLYCVCIKYFAVLVYIIREQSVRVT